MSARLRWPSVDRREAAADGIRAAIVWRKAWASPGRFDDPRAKDNLAALAELLAFVEGLPVDDPQLTQLQRISPHPREDAFFRGPGARAALHRLGVDWRTEGPDDALRQLTDLEDEDMRLDPPPPEPQRRRRPGHG